VYHSENLNLKHLANAGEYKAPVDQDEMSPALKELSKKAYIVIKHKVLPKQNQTLAYRTQRREEETS
jgi:hypothetical protein